MERFRPESLACPVVQAPMAGGPSTPALAAAVSGAGGLGFLAAGYTSVEVLRRQVAEVRRLADETPFGVNVFFPASHPPAAAEVAAYAARLRPSAGRAGTTLGDPRWDDDHYAAKIEFLCTDPVPVVSFTFGCPAAGEVDRLHAVGTAVWVTVTTPDEARAARAVGCDALVLQGVEAGGHRGGFDDTHPGDLGLLALVQLVATAVPDVPLVAAGGVSTGRGVAAVLAAGAAAAQLGTAFMLCPEAGTGAAQREVMRVGDRATALTRAFTGRTARGLHNRFLQDHTERAPSAYPEVHHLTAPLRAAARAAGDTDGYHLWAGQGYPLAQAVPARDLVRELTRQAAEALTRAQRRLQVPSSADDPDPVTGAPDRG